jgi:hypothetical protein
MAEGKNECGADSGAASKLWCCLGHLLRVSRCPAPKKKKLKFPLLNIQQALFNQFPSLDKMMINSNYSSNITNY